MASINATGSTLVPLFMETIMSPLTPPYLLNSKSVLSLGRIAEQFFKKMFGLLACMLFASSFAQPANEPLLERSSPVKPNILYILDNSTSMTGTQVDSQQFSRASGSCGNDNASLRSPLINLLYYNPDKRYIQGRNNSGDPAGQGCGVAAAGLR